MIRALLLDLDGVLRLWGEAHDQQTEARFGLPLGTMQAVAFEPALLEAAITGAVTDEVWRERIAQRLAEEFPEVDAAAATRFWSAPTGEVDPRVLALVRRCRQRIPVALVTNATSRLPRDLAALGLSGAFDAVVNSSAVGVAKPRPGIFRAALAAVGARPEEMLYFDDGAGHVAGARELGIVAHLYRGYDDFRRLLARHGCIAPGPEVAGDCARP